MESKYQVVLSTVPNLQAAKDIAWHVVENKLAACCNIVPGLTSIYSWNNKIQEDSELLLIIKTRIDIISELIEKIQELHPYEIPEIIALPINEGYSKYLNWVNENVKKS